jgi:hypothetical protein
MKDENILGKKEMTIKIAMKPLLCIGFFLLALFSNGCITTGNMRSRNSDDLSGKNDSSFAEYQIESYHPRRTLTHLKPSLDSLAKGISGILNDIRVKSKIRGKSISFFVLPSGRFKNCGITNYPNPDPQILKDTALYFAYYKPDSTLNALIDSIATVFKTDSIPNYTPNLWVTGNIKDEPPGFVFSFKDTSFYTTGLTGGRSRASIMRVVIRELPKLKHAYNRKLRSNPGLQGKITVKFAIDEFGDVIFSEVMHDGTTVDDRELQNEFASIVKAWKFQRIPKPGDVTEVVYPFTLSQ